jgi:hypothetical protein
MRGLGQAPDRLPAVYGPPTPEQEAAWRAGSTPTVPPAGQGSGSPVDQAYRDLLTSARPSSDPLDYISPQSAIAAGLEPSAVYAAWSNSLRSQIASGKIKSQQDAIAQGWAPGVVTELWTQASSAAATTASTSWLDQAPFGVANKWLLAGGTGIFLLVGMRGKR